MTLRRLLALLAMLGIFLITTAESCSVTTRPDSATTTTRAAPPQARDATHINQACTGLGGTAQVAYAEDSYVVVCRNGQVRDVPRALR